VIKGEYFGEKVDLSTDITIYDIYEIALGKSPLVFKFNDAYLKTPTFDARGANALIKLLQDEEHGAVYEGNVRIDSLVILNEVFENFRTDLEGNATQVLAKDIFSMYNQGTIQGGASVVFEPQMSDARDVSLIDV